ncbi:hypothetical protein ACHWQZ_G013590 [Mnemiopsis leidyi]
MRLPNYGIGTYKLEDVTTLRNVINAVLPLGVRLFDTAQWYCNEHLISEVLSTELPKHGLTREDVVIVSKVHPRNHGYEKARASTLESISHFKYIDMMLVHWPGMHGSAGVDMRAVRTGTWRALEELMQSGQLRGIGVSNYTVSHLEELMEYTTSGPPSVLQSEFHPRCQQAEVRGFCDKHNVQFMGYTPLGRQDLFNKPLVREVGDKYGITPSQVLLKWGLQKGAVTIPRSSKPDRNVENATSWTDGVSLKQEDMDLLDQLNDDHHYCWNPDLL